MKTIIFLALLVGIIFGSAIVDASTPYNQVYTICNRASRENNRESEQACGDLQDKYNIKYETSSPAIFDHLKSADVEFARKAL